MFLKREREVPKKTSGTVARPATTENARYDRALVRRFQPIRVLSPDEAETLRADLKEATTKATSV